MYGEKQIIRPQGTSAQTNGMPQTPPPPFSASDYSYPAKSRIVTGFLDLIMPLVTFCSLSGIVSFVFYDGGIGVTGCYLGFLGFTTLYIVTKQRNFPLKALYPLCLCVITCMTYSLRYTEALIISVPLLFYFSGLYCMTLTNTKGSCFESYLSLYNQAKAIIFIPHAKLFLPVISLWQNRKTKHIKLKKGYLGMLTGIICGIPVFIVVANLLIKGDAAFSVVMNGFTDKTAGLLEKVFDKLFGFIDDPLMIIIALLFTPWVASTVFSFRHGVINKYVDNSNTEKTVGIFRFVNDGILSGFYGIIALCYVIYLFSQFSYLFGAFSGNIPLSVNISLSEYARQGFFEMSTVAAINLCLIGAGAILAKRKENGRPSKLYKGFTAFFSVFTIILIATAMSKMALYINELGLTEKRILVSVADIILALTFICILIKLIKNDFPYMKIIMYTALTLITAYLALSPDFMIARYNTNAYLSGKHETIDLDTIRWLSDRYEVYTALNKLKDSDNEVIAATAKYEIYSLYESNTEYGTANTSFNEYRLHKQLKENAEEIKTYKKYSYYEIHRGYDIEKLMKETKENGSLFETKSTKISLTINTEQDINSIYLFNSYTRFAINNPEYGSTQTADWEYTYNANDCFAEIEIENAGFDYESFKIYLEKDEKGKAIIKNEYHFELINGENGKLEIIEK